MEKTVEFKSQGLVIGNFWGGGQGFYGAKSYTASSKEELLKINEEALKTGSLDAGMGYESLIGARLEIICTTTIMIDGKQFTNSETEIEFIGEMSEDQINFLEGVYD